MSSTQRGLPTLNAIPCVVGVALGSEEARIGRGLGYFGQVTIELADFVDDDARSEDPFASHASRSGLDLTAGTYFSKLLARNPYWTGRAIRVIEGWSTDATWHSGDAQTHYFFVRDIQGPTDGKVRITAVGPLQQIALADAEAPAPSEGRLAADITNVATAAVIHDATIAGDYPASGYVRIGDEVCAFTRSGVNLTLTRGSLDTVADDHSADDTIQLCLRYSAAAIEDILEDLLATYGGVPTSQLDLAGWATEAAAYLVIYNLTATISTPTKVLDLVQELLETAALTLWWDDAAGKVKLRAFRPQTTTSATWTDRLHLLGPPVIKREIAERVSRTDVLVDLRNPVKDARDASSYKVRMVGLSQGEEATEHGKHKLKLIPSRWLSSGQISIAIRTSYAITSQLRDGRQTITVEVAAKDASLTIGDVVAVSARELVDRRGVLTPQRCVVSKREPIDAGSRYRYLLERANAGARFIFLCDTGTPEYSLASASERDPGWFLGPADGTGPIAGDPPYVLG
jgi:hypothetical protein